MLGSGDIKADAMYIYHVIGTGFKTQSQVPHHVVCPISDEFNYDQTLSLSVSISFCLQCMHALRQEISSTTSYLEIFMARFTKLSMHANRSAMADSLGHVRHFAFGEQPPCQTAYIGLKS